MISCQLVINCMCVLLFNISYITDDIPSARYKLCVRNYLIFHILQMISCQPVISCMCVLLFNISNITDDILSSCYKLYVCVTI